jgi:ABC-type transport system involved in multi-copper enzyme maturation permease subunit
MFNLILKDILIQKKALVFAFLYSIFMFFVFSQPSLNLFIYSMGAVAISYMLIMTALQADYKNDTITILSSLPVKRSEIVASKYLSMFVFIALSFLVLVVVGLLIMVSPLPFSVRYPKFYDLVIAFLSVGILISVYLPVYFKTGGKYAQVIFIFFFMLMFFGPSILFGYFTKSQDQSLVKTIMLHTDESLLMVYLIAILFTLIILAVSFVISLRIHLNKDL